jgi:two-component system, NarL family, sensor histidine kinase DesK
MSGAGRPADDAVAPRGAWTYAAAFLCLVLPARLASAALPGGLTGMALAAALFVLPLLYTIPSGRRVWARHRNGLLAGQAVLTFLPFAVLGSAWAALFSGLLGGLLLLTVRAPVSWMLFGAAVALEQILRIVLPIPAQSLPVTAWTLIVSVNTAVTLFGLVRLADLVTYLRATRMELAALAVSRQRLRSAERLRAAIGDRLEAIAVRARTAQAAMATGPAEARAQLIEAAGIARQALEQVRMTVAGDDRDPGPVETGRAGDTVAPRVARMVLLVILCGFLAQLLLNVLTAPHSVPAKVGAAAVIVVVLVLQLYHSLARRDGARPRGWPWTLAAQTLCAGSFWVFDDVTLLGLAGFSAGSALLLLPARWGWAALVAAAAGAGLLMATFSAYGIFDGVYVGALTAATGLVVYGLSRLTDLADQVGLARRELARMAVVQERLRVARDTHDLLGLGLSAVALKCDLAVRLIGRDDDRAGGELEQLLTIAAHALGDLRSVTGPAQRHLSLRTELTAARDTLASAGVEVRAEVPDVPVPAAVDEALATVLREAVTNVLRHATATWCTVQLARTGDLVRLQVANDGAPSTGAQPTGVPGAGAPGIGGAGIGNLRARMAALGGRLDAGPDGADRFAVTVELRIAPRR